MPQDYFIDERNRTRPAPFAGPGYDVAPRPAPPPELTVDPRTGQAVIPAGGMRSPFRPKDPTLAQRYGELPGNIGRFLNKPPMEVDGMRVDLGGMLPAAGMVKTVGRAAKAGTGLHPRGVQGTPGNIKGYAAELQKGGVKQPREVIFPGSKPGPRYLPSQRELEWKRTHHMSGARSAPVPPPPQGDIWGVEEILRRP